MTTKKEKAMANMPQQGFQFDAENHIYLLDGKPLTGVTTILGVIAKPALIQWSADEAVKYLGWFNDKYENKGYEALTRYEELKQLEFEKFFQILTEARTQHAKRKKSAGDVGHNAHEWIERYIKAKIQDPHNTVEFEADTEHITKTFVKWANDNKVKFLDSEKRLYSQRYWYAGTVDFVCEINGNIFIGDVKTGGGIYPEHFFQTAGYQLALQEMGLYHNITGHIILNCKKDGTFDLRQYYDYELNRDAFLAALTLYRAMEKIKV